MGVGNPQIVQLPPEIRDVQVYPDIPDDDLICAGEPIVPAMVMTDSDLAQWAEMVRQAGADCRSKLNTVKAIRDSWPKTNGAQPAAPPR